jgi:indolepyruvate ferredoxin oxidoreductase beta subunit
MLGATSPFLPFTSEEIEKAIASIFARKGDDVVNLNIRAYHAGRAVSDQLVVKAV